MYVSVCVFSSGQRETSSVAPSSPGSVPASAVAAAVAAAAAAGSFDHRACFYERTLLIKYS